MKSFKKFALLFVLLIVALIILPHNVFAETDPESLIYKIAPDGENAVLKSIEPKTPEEADLILSSVLTKMIDDPNYFAYGYPLEGSTYNVDITNASEDVEEFYESYELNVKFDEPDDEYMTVSNNLLRKIKSINLEIDPFESQGAANIFYSGFYMLEDLSLINYYKTSDKSELWNPGASVRGLRFIAEFNKAIEGTNVDIGLEVRMGDQDESLMYEEALGIASSYHNGYLYGFKEGVGIHIRRVIYIPEATSETTEAYIIAAQKRINEYLGNSTEVLVTYGGTISSLDEECLDRTVDTSATDGNYYNIKVGNRTYKFYILKGTADKLVQPNYMGKDFSSNIEITSDDSYIPLDTKLNVKSVKDNTIKEKIGTENYNSYDITLYSDYKQAKIEKLDNGKFEVKIPVSEALKGKDLTVYYITSDGKTEEHEVTVKDGYAIFTTDHFSIYTLAEKATPKEEPKDEPVEPAPAEEPTKDDTKKETAIAKVEAAETNEVNNAATKEVTELVKAVMDNKAVKGIDKETAEKIKAAINDGKTVKVEVSTPTVEKEKVAEDAKKVEAKISEGTKVATYYDIDVLVKAGSETLGNVTELDNEIEVTVAIPTDLPKVEEGYTREYYIIRVHDGDVKELKATVSGDNISFKTNLFSTYALAYKDVKNSETPKTGDNIILYVVIFIAAVVGSVITIRKIRK